MSGVQILEKVLKPKCGYASGLGHGIKPSTSRSREAELKALLQAERIESEKRNGELEEKIKSQ